jgi:hypothetical protein
LARKQDTLVVGAEAFMPVNSSIGYQTNVLSARYISTVNSTLSLRKPVYLPPGVTVKSIEFFFYDRSLDANIKIELRENYLEEGFVGTTQYILESSGPVEGGWDAAGNIAIKGVMIVYEH